MFKWIARHRMECGGICSKHFLPKNEARRTPTGVRTLFDSDCCVECLKIWRAEQDAKARRLIGQAR